MNRCRLRTLDACFRATRPLLALARHISVWLCLFVLKIALFDGSGLCKGPHCHATIGQRSFNGLTCIMALDRRNLALFVCPAALRAPKCPADSLSILRLRSRGRERERERERDREREGERERERQRPKISPGMHVQHRPLDHPHKDWDVPQVVNDSA